MIHPGDMAGKGPLGPKGAKPLKAPRRALRRISNRRAAYLASDERKAGLDHMAAVARLPCLICGAWPSEAHHEGKPRSDTNVLPLCPRHHLREFGPGAYHYSPKAFYALHGDSKSLLDRVAALLRADDADCLGEWL